MFWEDVTIFEKNVFCVKWFVGGFVGGGGQVLETNIFHQP